MSEVYCVKCKKKTEQKDPQVVTGDDEKRETIPTGDVCRL